MSKENFEMDFLENQEANKGSVVGSIQALEESVRKLQATLAEPVPDYTGILREYFRKK